MGVTGEAPSWEIPRRTQTTCRANLATGKKPPERQGKVFGLRAQLAIDLFDSKSWIAANEGDKAPRKAQKLLGCALAPRYALTMNQGRSAHGRQWNLCGNRRSEHTPYGGPSNVGGLLHEVLNNTIDLSCESFHPDIRC
jgi:hypothetical protein